MTDLQASHYIFLPHLAPAWCKAFWKEGNWARLFSLYLSSSPSSLSSLNRLLLVTVKVKRVGKMGDRRCNKVLLSWHQCHYGLLLLVLATVKVTDTVSMTDNKNRLLFGRLFVSSLETSTGNIWLHFLDMYNFFFPGRQYISSLSTENFGFWPPYFLKGGGGSLL